MPDKLISSIGRIHRTKFSKYVTPDLLIACPQVILQPGLQVNNFLLFGTTIKYQDEEKNILEGRLQTYSKMHRFLIKSKFKSRVIKLVAYLSEITSVRNDTKPKKPVSYYESFTYPFKTKVPFKQRMY